MRDSQTTSTAKLGRSTSPHPAPSGCWRLLQATAASHGLSGEAQELARLVGQFRIGENVSAPVLKRAVPKAPPKQRVLDTAGRKVVALPGRDKAPRPAMADGADDWNEF